MKQITKDKALVYSLDIVKYTLWVVLGAFVGRGWYFLFHPDIDFSMLAPLDFVNGVFGYMTFCAFVMYCIAMLIKLSVDIQEKYDRAKENIRYHKDGRLR